MLGCGWLPKVGHTLIILLHEQQRGYPYIGATYDEDGELLSSTSSSDILPNVAFTPDNVLYGKLDQYVSLPVLDDNVTYDNIQE